MMKLGELLTVWDALSELVSKPLKTSVGYRLSVFLKKADVEYSLFVQKRNDLFKELGELTDGESAYKIKEENMVKFRSEIESMLDTEIDLTFPKVKLSEIDNVELEGKHMLTLADVVIEDNTTN